MCLTLKSVAMFLFSLVVLGSSPLLVSCQNGQFIPDQNCDFQQQIVPGKSYTIRSPYYPNRYPRGIKCRWLAEAPSRSKIVLSCTNFSIPWQEDCTIDQFRVSLTGSTSTADFHKYCGTGTFSLESVDRLMLMEFSSSYYTNSGTFECSITATTQQTTPPQVCDCGRKLKSKIVNGKETGINEYPMMAALVSSVAPIGLFCGCTIISPHFVMTAAHCLLRKYPENVGVLVGDHDLSTRSETNATKLYRAEQFIAPPDYDSVLQVNDIALVKTADYIVYSLQVGPVCLPFKYCEVKEGDKVIVLGWGTIAQSEAKSDVLLQTTLEVRDIKMCQTTFERNNVTDKQICTWSEGTDACQADSGGPVLVEDKNQRIKLCGIVSYGKGCATSFPGVNTRVASYLPWIMKETGDDSFIVA